MKKLLISVSAVIAFSVCCMLGFSAYAADISTAVVALDQTSYTYAAEACTPTPTVSVYDEYGNLVTLTKDVDYTVDYSKNKNVGIAKVKITGIGANVGTITSEFAITPAEISKASFVRSANATTSSQPQYIVTFNNKNLVEGTDYTMEVSGLDKCGVNKATVTFTGTGNFTGTRTSKINVYPSKVSALQVTNNTSSSFVLSWTSQSSSKVSGYKVYSCNADGTGKKTVKTVTSNSVKISTSSASIKYYCVRAYVNSSDKTLYGEYSDVVTTCTKPAKVSIESVAKSKKKGVMNIKWAKTACTGYEVQYTTDKKFKNNVQTVVVDASSKKLSLDMDDESTYYARVRAFVTNGGQNIYGEWSSKLSTKYSKTYSTYTTNYVNKPKRTTNLKLACKAINGTIIQPGEVFSFNGVVGERTAAKGYKEATIFTGSSSTSESLGGGVCQVASTMFNAALIGNLEIVERYQHSQRVAYCPLGRDAAIYWGSENFRFRNTTNYPIKIVMKCENGKLTCTYKVSYDVKPKKVKLTVGKSGKTFTLKRSVGGKTNYTTKSTY